MRHYIVLFEFYDEVVNDCPLNKKEREDEFVGTVREFGSWWTYFTGVYIVKTNLSISLMHECLKKTASDHDMFLILEVDLKGQRQGFIPLDAWDWLNTNR